MSPDVEIEFTLSPQRKSPLSADEWRVPLFVGTAPGGGRIGHGVILDLSGATPIRPGEKRQVRGEFFSPAEARSALPEGTAFVSFELQGRILKWLSAPEVAAAE